MPGAPLVTLAHVHVELGGMTVLRDVTWQLQRGEHWGVVGENGSGKSTLLGLIAGTVWPAPERGIRRYDFGAGVETDAVRARSEIVLVGHELQDRYARLNWNFTALDVVLSGIYRTDVPRRRPAEGQRERAQQVLRRLGVAELASRRFLELSRGEQRRVLIARGVAFEATVLLLDEPASGLDTAARQELAAMLELVARECTLVCAAHAQEDLPVFIERYLQIDAGRATAVDRRTARAAARYGCAAPQPVWRNSVAGSHAFDRARARRRVARGTARAARRDVAFNARRALARDRRQRLGQEQLAARHARPAQARARRLGVVARAR